MGLDRGLGKAKAVNPSGEPSYPSGAVETRRETRRGRLGAVVAVVIGVRRPFERKSYIGVSGMIGGAPFQLRCGRIHKVMLKSVPRSASTWKSKD